MKIDYEYYESKEIKTETSYVKSKGKKILFGPTKHYFESGNLKAEYNYVNGRLNGVQSFYNELGQLTKREIYNDGDLIEVFNY